MIFAQNVLWLIVLIGVMILVHELGHYWAARIFDVRIDAFSFGFGWRIWGFRRGETDFRVSAIPFGGYVKMAGEQPGDENINDPRAFIAKPRWQRLIIAAAGPGMNVVLAVALLTGLFMFRYQRPPDPRAFVGHVFANSAAAKAGIKEGDRIIQLEDKRDPTWEDITIKEMSGAGQPLQVKVERGNKTFWTTVTPTMDERSGLGYAGWQEEGEIQVANLSPGMPADKAGLQRGDVVLSANGQPIRSQFRLQEVIRAGNGKPVDLEYRRNGAVRHVIVQPVYEGVDGPQRWMIGVLLQPRLITTQLSLPAAFSESVRQNVRSAGLIYDFLGGIVERRTSAKSLEGPIGIAKLSGEAAREGPGAFIGLMAMVSLNLAIFNLLPIPILDGGRILMLGIESVMRRDLSIPVQEAVFKVGFFFLMALVVFVLYNDISKILPVAG